MVVRVGTVGDAEAVAAIYAPVVADTAVSFETYPPSAMEMRDRIQATLQTLPWLVSLDGAGAVDGYAYGSKHRERAAYGWSVDTTVYVRADRRRAGVGRTLYEALIPALQALGYRSAFAGIALPNDASVALHESVGFTSVGVFHRVGFKLGGWRDVGWWELGLGGDEPPMETPRKFVAL